MTRNTYPAPPRLASGWSVMNIEVRAVATTEILNKLSNDAHVRQNRNVTVLYLSAMTVPFTF